MLLTVQSWIVIKIAIGFIVGLIFGMIAYRAHLRRQYLIMLVAVAAGFGANMLSHIATREMRQSGVFQVEQCLRD